MFLLDSKKLREAYIGKYALKLQQLYEKEMQPFTTFTMPRKVREFFVRCIKKSESLQFNLENEIIKYAFITIYLGNHFDTDALYQNLRAESLWQRSGVHPNIGLNRLFDIVDLMVAESISGNKRPFNDHLLNAGSLILARELNIDTFIDRLMALDLKRSEFFGKECIQKAIISYDSDLDTQPDYRSISHAWFCYSYFLGYKFYKNPLYDWLPDYSLEKGPIAALEKLHGK